jgi:hypothetical protein
VIVNNRLDGVAEGGRHCGNKGRRSAGSQKRKMKSAGIVRDKETGKEQPGKKEERNE